MAEGGPWPDCEENFGTDGFSSIIRTSDLIEKEKKENSDKATTHSPPSPLGPISTLAQGDLASFRCICHCGW